MLKALTEGTRMRDYETSFFWLSDAMIVNIAYNTTEPSIGLNLNADNSTLKCYMADTGLLISHAFNESSIVTENLYNKLLTDKLEFITKYGNYLSTPYVIHTSDFRTENGITYLPLYMTPLL